MFDYLKQFTVIGNPIGKPRMTKADVWKKRDIVLRYRKYADDCRSACTGDKEKRVNDESVTGIIVNFYFSAPLSLSSAKTRKMAGTPHRIRPDLDNCIKSVLDSLFDLDSKIYFIQARKYWCAGGEQPRTEITLLTDNR